MSDPTSTSVGVTCADCGAEWTVTSIWDEAQMAHTCPAAPDAGEPR
jgi:ribosomal protein S27E